MQIAGLVARRIVTFVREGETVGAGQRIRSDPFRFARGCLSCRPARARSSASVSARLRGETVLADLQSAGAGARMLRG